MEKKAKDMKRENTYNWERWETCHPFLGEKR
jgi:hypothetical protein